MMRAWKLGRTTALIGLGGMLVACHKTPLQSLNQVFESSVASTQANVKFCTDPAFEQKQYLKTIIVLDHSGSNQQNYKMSADGSGAPQLVNGVPVINSSYATDPTGTTRYGTTQTKGTLLNYLSTLPANNPADPTKYFALVDFSTQVSTYPANSSGFSSDINDFYTHVLADATAGAQTPADGGATDYEAALSAVYRIVSADVQNAQKCAALAVGSASPGTWCPTPGVAIASSYVVVFMSDGSPITDLSGIGVDASGNVVVTGQIKITKEPASDILAQVGTLTALTSNTKFVTSVNLFTIYYYAPGNIDQSGQALLANMAKAGNGIAYNALSGSNIDYSQFQPPAKMIKYKLSDVLVTNASVTWWSDNQLHADTDMDGLPDDIERAWGTDPTRADSDGNGVSDFVEYQLAAGQARGSKIDFVNGLCKGLKHQTLAGAVIFPSGDPDGLNDCEKLALNDIAGIGNADSNGDLIADFLELKSGLPFQIGTTPSINVRDQDGFTPYQKIKYSLPANISATQILNFTPASYDLRLLSSTAVQDCYALNVSNLPTLTAKDTIRVDVFENSELLQQNALYRVARKPLSQGQVNFSDWNDVSEIAAHTWSKSP